MSRLDELINELCPNGVEFKCLGDIGQVKMCKRILKSQTNTNGGIPFWLWHSVQYIEYGYTL